MVDNDIYYTNESSDEITLHLTFDGTTSIFEDDDDVKSSVVEQNVFDGSKSPSDESTSSIFDEDMNQGGDDVNSSDSMALDVVEYHDDGDDMSALDDDKFYYCDEATTTAIDVSQEGVVADDGKHLIKFDYDLLVTSSTEKPINYILQVFEKQLLLSVGSKLCSSAQQQTRNIMLRHRRRLVGEDATSSLKELSSLPNDEVAEDMKCSTTTSSSEVCHQINGYMIAYYDSNTSTLFDDDIELQILDTIKSSMDSFSNTVDNQNPFDNVDIVGINYVGIRDSSSTKDSNLVDNNMNATSSSTLSKGELAGLIIGCILGVLISVIITICWYNKHSKKKKKKGGTQATDENDEGLDNEYYRGRKCGNNNSVRGSVEVLEDELSIIPPVSYNPEPPTAAFSNTTGYNQEMLSSREDDEAWLSNLTTETYETEATQKASNTTTPHWRQRRYYTSHQETIDERDDEEESYY